MKKGIHFLYGQKESALNLRDTVINLAQQGFKLIEIPPDSFLEGEDIVEFRKIVMDHGSDIAFCCGLPLDCDMTSDDPVLQKNGINYVHRVIQIMAKGHLTLLLGSSWTPWPNCYKDILPFKKKDEILERTAKVYSQAIKTVEDYGIKVAIEPMNRFENYLINTVSEGIRFCEMVGNQNLGLLLDCFHMSIEETCIVDAIIEAGPLLYHMHLAERNRSLPGMGDINWIKVFAALKRINYSGFIDIESFIVGGGDIAASVNLWRDLTCGADNNRLFQLLRESVLFLDKTEKALYN